MTYDSGEFFQRDETFASAAGWKRAFTNFYRFSA
jgi:hypothetical protein